MGPRSAREGLDVREAMPATGASRVIGLANEGAGEDIRVGAVRPGLVRTGVHALGGEPGRMERLEDGVPMQRGGEPVEVARAAPWLASDESSYTTGFFVDVAGGR